MRNSSLSALLLLLLFVFVGKVFISGVAPSPRKRARVSAADAALMNSNAEFLARAAAVKLADERAVRRADAIICSGVRHNVSNATKSLVSHSFDVVMDTKTREQVAALDRKSVV